MKKVFWVLFVLFMGSAQAVTRCVKVSGEIVHGGWMHSPSEAWFSGVDWSNVVDGIKYTGVSRIQNNRCYCKIIGPVITEWTIDSGPALSEEVCSESCANAPNGSLRYTIIQ